MSQSKTLNLFQLLQRICAFVIFILVPTQLLCSYHAAKSNYSEEGSGQGLKISSIICCFCLVIALILYRYFEHRESLIYKEYSDLTYIRAFKLSIQVFIIGLVYPSTTYSPIEEEDYGATIRYTPEAVLFFMSTFKIIFMALLPLKLIEKQYKPADRPLSLRVHYSSLTKYKLVASSLTTISIIFFFGIFSVYFGLAFAEIERNSRESDPFSIGITSAANGIYFACLSLMNIGYGDYVPYTKAGKGFAILIVTLGLVLFALLVSRMVAWFGMTDEEKRMYAARVMDVQVKRIEADQVRLLIKVLERNRIKEEVPEQVFRKLDDNFQTIRHIASLVKIEKENNTSGKITGKEFLMEAKEYMAKTLKSDRYGLQIKNLQTLAEEGRKENDVLETKIKKEFENLKEILLKRIRYV